MSQDPNQPPSNYNEYPYGDPADPQKKTPDANPYGDAQNPYGASQYPYDGAPQDPIAYEAPQSANPYQVPANYAAPATSDPNFSYGSGMPEASPLPLGEAIRQLPGQYRRILTRPSAMTFAIERGKASWDIIWVQLLGYAIIVALLGLIGNFISPARYPGMTTTHLSPALLQAITVGTSIGLILLIPLSFFIHIGILHLVAKAFKGEGTFLQYAYNITLFIIPLGIISGLLGIIPVLGIIVSLAVSVYEIVLYVFATMGTYRLSGGKATAVILIPAAILLLLICVLTFAAIALLVKATHP